MPNSGITFEVQRRINQRDDYVRKALEDPAQLVQGMTSPLGDGGLTAGGHPGSPKLARLQCLEW